MSQGLYPFTFEELTEMNIRWRSLLSVPHYMTHAPQYLLSIYTFHREGHRCLGCVYGYPGHVELMDHAMRVWGWVDGIQSEVPIHNHRSE